MCFYQVFIHYGEVREGFSAIMTILSPFIYGLIMAYLLCPVYNMTVRETYRLFSRVVSKKRIAFRAARVIGTVVSLIVLFGVVGGLFALVLPETVHTS